MFDSARIKNDFPILSKTMNGKALVYLDSAATTQKPSSVIEAIANFYRTSNANIHRGVYTLSEEATEQYEQTRKKTAAFIHAKSVREVIFTRNTTESINLVAYSWARKFLKKGDHIILSEMEHHANFVPWAMLSKERGIQIKIVPLLNKAGFDIEQYRKLLGPQVKLVAITAMSNVLGTILPLREIIDLAHSQGALVLIDGAQSAPHMPTDVQSLDCDFFCFSAHKMLGPTGVGVLWARESLLEKMDPFMGGGEMINTVSLDNTTWADLPLKFEAGTSNFADVAAFSTSLDYLTTLGMDNIRAHEIELIQYALNRLGSRDDLIIYGPCDAQTQGGAISFNHKRIHAHDVGTILSDQGIAIRVGHHCAQPLMKALNISSTARASFYVYTTKDDIDALVVALDQVNRVFDL